MSSTHLLLLGLVVGVTLWWGRRIPLAGWRRRLVVAARTAAFLALCAALWGPPRRRTHEIPRRLVYLVDGSKSIDARQRAWMARRIASLESLRPRQMERAVIGFGREPRVIEPFGHAPLTDPAAIQRAMSEAKLPDDQTDLESALLFAVTLLPSSDAAGVGSREGRAGVVLLSDGRQTMGDVASILSSIRRLGLGVFPVPVPLSGEAKAVWESLAVPPVVQRGSSVPIQIVVFNAEPRPEEGRVSVALQGVTLKRQRVIIRPGWQVIRVTAPAIQRGTMALDIGLELPGQGAAEHRRAYTEVEGPPQLLVVTDHATSLPPLAAALKRREIEIAMARPGDLAVDAAQLLDHDAVLLFNVPKSSFSQAQTDALRTYVERFGGGLVMVGLGGDLAKEISTPAPLDALLPVVFEAKGLKEAKRRVCMMLLIDRSTSMFGPRIAATKRAAVELVNQLSPEDLVGILAFDTRPYVVAEVQPAGQVEPVLVEKLVKLRSTGGTDVYPALAAAVQRLDMTGAALKHIILLSDGNTPFQKEAYDALIKSMRLSGTTISTIGIGSAFINVPYLRFLAMATGGTFYQMRSLDELPQLVARDTHEALGRLPFTEGHFRPSKSPATEWFPDTANWPTLRGYLTATARPAAQVDLTVNGGDGEDPLLARWMLERGRVVSFTSDADARWSPEWIRWSGFEATWAQIVRWAMRPRFTEELFVWVDEHREPAQLVVEGELHEPRAELMAGPPKNVGGVPLASLDSARDATLSQVEPVALVQTGTWRWEASLEHVPSGWYQMSLESHPPAVSDSTQHGAVAGGQASPSGSTVFAKRWIQIGSPSLSRELAGQPPDAMLLRQMAHATAGVYDAPDRALLPPTTSGASTVPALVWALPLVIVALLVEIALRGSSML